VEEMKKEQLQFKARTSRAEGKLERAELLLGSADEEFSRLLGLLEKDFLKKTTTSRRKRTKRGRRRKSKGKKRRTRR